MEENGLVHLYVGDGKGKTTAAAGLALRALGQGKKVLFGQFLKGRPTGEIAPLEQLGATVLRAKTGEKFVFQLDEAERKETLLSHTQTLARIRELAPRFDLVVLDEVVDAMGCGMIPPQRLLEFVKAKPEGTELVLTGRNPPEELVTLCDYHTNFVCVAHPYQKGVAARRGVEY